MNRENFYTLAKYLMGNDIKADFTMTVFSEYLHIMELKSPTCGTVGCALGHMTLVNPDYHKGYGETWWDYCHRMFNIHSDDDEFEWCFGSFWSDGDNTPAGAGKRILYMLKHGVPEEFSEWHANSQEEMSDLDQWPRLYEDMRLEDVTP